MGYEVNVIIGEISEVIKPEDGKCYMNVISTFDLCKVSLSDLKAALKGKGIRILERIEEMKIIPVYFYGTDGNTRITKDLYDEELIAFEPGLLLEELKKLREKDNYRRFPPCIALLESLLASFGSPFYVVLFGH